MTFSDDMPLIRGQDLAGVIGTPTLSATLGGSFNVAERLGGSVRAFSHPRGRAEPHLGHHQ
jgi:hypothetical protein